MGQAYSIFRFSAIDCRLSWRYLWVIRAVMAGLVPATHVVRRVERSQASGKGGKLMYLQTVAVDHADGGRVFEAMRRGWPGQDRLVPAMTEGGSESQRKKTDNS
jgi:hypothetical protein